jgi:hypothetical protein
MQTIKEQIAGAVAKATLTTWSDGHGHVRDAICIPHPPGDDACWGDYPPETIEAIEAGALAQLAPGRTVVDGAGDEDGDYLILSAVGREYYCYGDSGHRGVRATSLQAAAEAVGIPSQAAIDDGGWLVVRDEETMETLIFGKKPQ